MAETTEEMTSKRQGPSGPWMAFNWTQSGGKIWERLVVHLSAHLYQNLEIFSER